MNNIPVISIDGLSSSGKSTVSKKLSRRLGFYILDSGILYRTFAYLQNIKKIKSFDQGKIRIAVSKEIFDNTKARLQSSIAYKKVLENKINEISSREFNDFFRLNDYMKKNQKNEKIQKIKNLFISDKEFKKIIDLIAETQNGGKNNV